MRISLPDGNELDLEDGATGLDAAAAIGPRLARSAVAVEVGGEVRDLRLPLHDGEAIRVLTDRDPEALAVLRHSTAHVMAEAVTHLWPGSEGRHRARDRRRLLLRLRVPGADLGRRPGPDRGRDAGHPAQRAPLRARRSGAQEPDPGALRQRAAAVQAGARPGPPGRRDQSLHPGRLRGSVPGAASPDDEADQGLQAALDRRRLLARRLPKPDADPDLRDGVLQPGRPGCAPAPAGGGAPPRPPPAGPRPRPLPHQRGVAGRALLAPTRDGGLERAERALAGAEPGAGVSRGAHADPLLRSRSGSARATGRSTARTCSPPTRTNACSA